MSTLEALYRRLMFAYPGQYRRIREDEIVGTLLDVARPGQRLPSLREAAGLILGGLRTRARFSHKGRRLLALSIIVGAFAGWLWTSSAIVAMGSARIDVVAILLLTGCFGGYAWLGTSVVAGTINRAAVIVGGSVGVAVGLIWVATVTFWITANANPGQPPLQWPALVAGLALPGVVAGLSARRTRAERAGMHVGMWTGLVAGPTFAIGVYWVMDAQQAFLPGAQDLSWSLVPWGAADAILGLLFLPVVCTLMAAIGVGVFVSWPRALPHDAWRGVPGWPLLLLAAVCSVAAYLVMAPGDGQVGQFDYYAPIQAADRAATVLDASNDVNAVTVGTPVDMASSNDTFVVVFNNAGRPIAGSVLVNGRPVVFPSDGLLKSRQESGTYAEDVDDTLSASQSSLHLGEWPYTQDGGPVGAVAIRSWSGGYVVAGHSLQPRFDMLIFGGVLGVLFVALVVLLNGRPGRGHLRPAPAGRAEVAPAVDTGGAVDEARP